MDERSLRVQQRLEWPVVIAALLVIPAIIFEESHLGEPWRAVGYVLDWASWLVFLAEIVIMLVVVPKKWAWVRSHPLDVAIVILTPPVVPPGVQFLRVFRLLRPLRLLRALSARTLLSLEGVRDAAVLVAIVVVASGAAFYETEKHTPGVNTLWDGIWWAFGTVTTVGSGNLVPETTTGRIVAIVLMFVGIGFVVLVTAFVAERFIRRSPVAETEDRILAKLESIEARLERIEESR